MEHGIYERRESRPGRPLLPARVVLVRVGSSVAASAPLAQVRIVHWP
jgi:hypothetical protein